MISVIVPVFNEAESVTLLHAELCAALEKIGKEFEIIFIDDGSTDTTCATIKMLQPARVVSFSRNFGKSQALQAGFSIASGTYIFTIDGDLQDDPAEMKKFIDAMESQDLDLVCGMKQGRKDDMAKRLVSKIANGITRFFTSTAVHDMNCGFKLFRAEVAQSLYLYGDMHRYIPALVAAQGYHIGEVSVRHRERKFGSSKFGNFKRFPKSIFDFITLLMLRKFIDRPMHLFGFLGAICSFLGMGILLCLTYVRLFLGESIGNRPLLILGVLLMVIGVQLFSSGFLGELIIRQKENRTVYRIREDIANQ